MKIKSGKRRRTKEKVSVLYESERTFEQFKDIQARAISRALQHNVLKVLPSVFITSEMEKNCDQQ